MILPLLLALLAFAAILPIVAPLFRGARPAPTRASFDQAVYRDQLQELDRDVARTLISQAEADDARLEIQRRLLAADRQPASVPRLSRSPILAVIVFAFIAAGSIASYLWIGAPGLPDMPFSSRSAELARDDGRSSVKKAADTLAAKLKQNPSDAPTWLLYGRTLALLGQWNQAEDAYRRAMTFGEVTPETRGDHAEILVMQAGGTVTPAAQAAFEQVLKDDPGNRMAKYYLALGAKQAGEPRKAIDAWQSLLAELPANSPLRSQLGQRITEAAQSAGIPVPALAAGTAPVAGDDAGSGPDAKAVADAANMTDAQRQAMIRGMVAKLAEKQAADPSNLDGWLRLARAYVVLHEADKAADAYDKAAGLKPDDVAIPLEEARALLSGHAPSDKLSPRVIGLLKRVEAASPDQPVVLWYLGMAALQDAHPDEARRYWGKLLTKLPPGSDEAKTIQSALDTLSRPTPGG